MDPLARLKDIHLPVEPGLWPPAPGWWILGLLVLAAVWAGWRLYRQHARNNQPERDVIAGLMNIDTDCDDDLIPERLMEMSALVRRLAIHRYGRSRVASLNGERWLEFLDGKSANSSDTGLFVSGAGRAMGTALYQPGIEVDLSELKSRLIHWARSSRP